MEPAARLRLDCALTSRGLSCNDSDGRVANTTQEFWALCTTQIEWLSSVLWQGCSHQSQGVLIRGPAACGDFKRPRQCLPLESELPSPLLAETRARSFPSGHKRRMRPILEEPITILMAKWQSWKFLEKFFKVQTWAVFHRVTCLDLVFHRLMQW